MSPASSSGCQTGADSQAATQPPQDAASARWCRPGPRVPVRLPGWRARGGRRGTARISRTPAASPGRPEADPTRTSRARGWRCRSSTAGRAPDNNVGSSAEAGDRIG
ncbi:hypothetical protein ON010_g12503 [Phytophthora cinnamomi]|nr:hypothetical protein ON010_g12503 [Phytophthora cinnamomi]